jgi:thiol-disulfide isomerase/thioredoxin
MGYCSRLQCRYSSLSYSIRVSQQHFRKAFMHANVQVKDTTKSTVTNRKNNFLIARPKPFLIYDLRSYCSHCLKIMQLFMFPKPKPVFAIVAVVLNPGIPIPLRGYFFMHETVQVKDATRSKARNRKNIFFISHYNPFIDNSRNY